MDPPTSDPKAYAAVAQIIERSCAKQTCHGELTENAHLNFMNGDFRAALVDVPSCEYSQWMRIEPGAPQRSWIMLKLTGPTRFRQYMNFVDFVPDPSWRPGAPECTGHFDDGSPWFGTQMPPPDTTTISPDDIETIRAWIERGAPGP